MPTLKRKRTNLNLLQPNYNVIESKPVLNTNENYEGPIIPINTNRIMEARRGNLANLPPLAPYTIPPSFFEPRKPLVKRKAFGTLPIRLQGGKKISQKRKWRSRSSTRRR
jgi:hypothetical protein